MVPGWELYAHTAEAHPLLMDCLNSIVLWSLGDAAAQRLEGLPRFRLRRLLSTAAYAFFFIAPFAHYWYMGLDWLAGRMFALGSPAFVLTKVAIDLAIFGSLHVIGFFAYLTLAEGGSWQEVRDKIRTDFWPTYTAELLFWSVYQTANFIFVPVLYQVLAVNVATLFDSTFLCWARSRADWAAGIKRWLRLGGSSGDSKPGTQGSGGAHCEGAAGAKWARLPSSESAADVEGGEAGAPQEVQVAAPQEGA